MEGRETMSDKLAIPDAFWSLKPEDLLTRLQSSDQGLSSAEASARLASFGLNRLHARKRATALDVFLSQFKSPIILILVFATIVSAALGDWTDAIIILLIVLGSALLSFWQEFRASNAVEQLRSQISLKVSVMRDGQ